MQYGRLLVAVALGAFLIACGPGPGEPDAGGGIDSGDDEVDSGDTELDSGDIEPDSGNSCAGVEEGTFTCAGTGRQCCDGTWHVFSDGPCWGPPDAGGVDAGATDCTATPNEPGCPCADGAEDTCRPFRSSLRCVEGVWTERVNIACCVF